MTPHISAQKDEIAKIVLMPGDPLRAKFIAEKFLANYKLVSSIRNNFAYTGTYKGKQLTVMSSGMGVPSMCLYSYELYNFYQVDTIIRVGTAGAVADKCQLRDVVVGIGASTTSAYVNTFNLPGTFAPIADFTLAAQAVEIAKKMNINVHAGNLLTTDTFYDGDPDFLKKWQCMGILAVEMEAAGLYMNAAKAGKKALAICTISDRPLHNEFLTAEVRQHSFTDMMEVALELAQQQA